MRSPPGTPGVTVASVEVSPDGGAQWVPAKLTGPEAPFAWKLWVADVQVAAACTTSVREPAATWTSATHNFHANGASFPRSVAETQVAPPSGEIFDARDGRARNAGRRRVTAHLEPSGLHRLPRHRTADGGVQRGADHGLEVLDLELGGIRVRRHPFELSRDERVLRLAVGDDDPPQPLHAPGADGPRDDGAGRVAVLARERRAVHLDRDDRLRAASRRPAAPVRRTPSGGP